LGGILRCGAIAEKALSERHEMCVMRTENGIERVLVACFQAVQQIAIVHEAMAGGFSRDWSGAVPSRGVPVYSTRCFMIR
jgi:ABC-type sulfate transport system substrate-binding protein